MRIYLDFDGVLHPVNSPQQNFVHLPSLEALLRENPGIEVVISSSWRAVFSEEYIKDHFFSEHVANRIVGVTPIFRELTRYDEILVHIQQTGYEGDFIVIDDEPHQFPSGWPPLLICNPDEGLNAEKIEELKGRIFSVSTKR